MAIPEVAERVDVAVPNALRTVAAERPRVAGKFLYVGDQKLYVKGVTYGSFRPDENGCCFPDPDQVRDDFQRMSDSGVNAVRTYTPPAAWLLDLAAEAGLYVMIGLPWEQHITFLDEPDRADRILQSVRDAVRRCAGHPAVLCYAIGNEIPASVVRWHGKRQIENFLRKLYLAAKQEDPEGLFTYVNFPTTEYLDLPFLDFVSFNVYLEQQHTLLAYLARLQNLSNDRPLLMAEIGLDSQRNGRDAQATTLDWQIRTVFAAGCAGVFVFAWTDEWHRGGFDIEDWDFGLVTRDRRPKAALDAVSQAFVDVPFSSALHWPRISVVVCTYNGRKTIGELFAALDMLDYPDYEAIVVSDGSNDGCVALACGYGMKIIAGPNRGLSAARNAGMAAATGEIVVYIDDDAVPDPHWLRYLAYVFMTTKHVAVGGPNIAPPGDGPIAECVANSPGNPCHVLISDLEAEHLPGCNMAYRRSYLQAVGGFDTRFRIAGDDVDVCWKLLKQGWTLGFSAAAMVWHHPRNSVRTYWRQQRNYGIAEAMLERKWPEKYNLAGHALWTGNVYGKGHTLTIRSWRPRVYQGVWGSASFQTVYPSGAGWGSSLPLMPEWYLVNLLLVVMAGLGLWWSPLLCSLPLLAFTTGVPLAQAAMSSLRADFSSKHARLYDRVKLHALTALLHIAQPMARLWGRLRGGLAPWRLKPRGPLGWPAPRRLKLWSECWQPPEYWLRRLHTTLADRGLRVLCGGEFDSWDLAVQGGLFGSARLRMAIEEHGSGKQNVRLRLLPEVSLAFWLTAAPLLLLAAAAAKDAATPVAVILGSLALFTVLRVLLECSVAIGGASRAVDELRQKIVEQV
jgi:GT2 family glycosyltransferase